MSNSSACHAYIMWAELGHCHFLYVPTEPLETARALIMFLNGIVCFGLSLVSSLLSTALLL